MKYFESLGVPVMHQGRFDGDNGTSSPLHFDATDTNFAIKWKGNYRIDGEAFVYIGRDVALIVTILGYPTARSAELG